MNRGLLTFLFFTTCSLLLAQELPYETAVRDFCSPGVINKSPSKGILLEYGYQPAFNLILNEEESIRGRVQANPQILIKLKAPLVNKDRFKMLLGFNYFQEDYEVSTYTPFDFALYDGLNHKELKTSALTLSAFKSLNYKTYMILRGEVGFSGDFDGLMPFSNRYGIYRGVSVFGFKENPSLEWGFGFIYKKSFRNEFLYPFLFYNKTFNHRWGIETVLPVQMRVRYNFDRQNLLLFGTEYQSSEYSIDLLDLPGSPGNNPYIFNYSLVQLSVAYQRNIHPWVWLEAKTGYSRSIGTHFGNTHGKELFNAAPINGYFATFGIFLSPPKRDKN